MYIHHEPEWKGHKTEKELLEAEIRQNEEWLQETSNPMKARRRKRTIKELKAKLKQLNENTNRVC